jgi:glycosyltransferase involved in cell wall biosynthesis
MRLAVVETAPHGGLLQYAGQLADALAERGHAVDVVTARGGELEGRLSAARLRAVLPAPVARPGEPPTGWRYTVRRAGIATRLAAGAARTLVELRRGRYDAAVLVDDLDVALKAAGALALAVAPGGPRLAAICHEPRPRNRWAGQELYVERGPLHRLLAALYPRLDLVLLHGERSRSAFADAWPPSRTAVIPHGDERLVAGEPGPPSAEEHVLFFGDWRRAKGLHLLLEAFDRVRERRPAATLTIAGRPSPDSDPDTVRRWARERAGHVQLVDRYVALEDVPALFDRARVVATPYLAGSQSGVVHLAMTMARAVVTSDTGELGEAVVDGQTGLVVPAGDAGALAGALETVLGDPDLAARLGAAGRRRVLEEFGWERVAERVERELLALDRPAGHATAS